MKELNQIRKVDGTGGGAPIPPGSNSPAVQLSKKTTASTAKLFSGMHVETPDLKRHKFNTKNHDKFDDLLK